MPFSEHNRCDPPLGKGSAGVHEPCGDQTTVAVLRADLDGIYVGKGHRHAWMVIDDIGGRFARIPEHLWRMLTSGKASNDLWAQADAAGWTRRRAARPSSDSKLPNPLNRPQSLLAIRIPLFQFDAVARHLLGTVGWIFSATAVRMFLAMMLLASLWVMTQYQEIAKTISELPALFSGATAWSIGIVFLVTKLLHELGHAVACRRVEARCGQLGVIFFFGIPCPYCDVTQVWRIADWRSRAGVMMAGMYAEGILATAATLVWTMADEGPLQLHAMNVMIVCSVSTLIFNANPLMRYDGYYVLADWIGSVNLRQEARLAFGRVWNQPRSIRQRRVAALAFFYVASTVYRCLVLVAIATVVLAYAESAGLKLLAISTLIAAGGMMVAKGVARFVLVSRSASTRRIGGIVLSLIVLGGLLFISIPRRVSVTGYVDAQEVTEVFLGSDGVIERVVVDFGQQVKRGEILGRIRADEIDVQTVRVQGQLNVASLRSRSMRRRAIEDLQSSSQLESLEAVQRSLEATLVSLDRQRNRLALVAPDSGLVIPTLRKSSHADSSWGNQTRLSDRIGMRSVRGESWCRVASSHRLAAVFFVDPKYREHLAVGDRISGYDVQSPSKIKRYRIASISSVRTGRSGAMGGNPREPEAPPSHQTEPFVEVFCQSLDATEDDANRFLSRLGAPCHGVIRLPSRSLGSDLITFLKELFS